MVLNAVDVRVESFLFLLCVSFVSFCLWFCCASHIVPPSLASHIHDILRNHHDKLGNAAVLNSSPSDPRITSWSSPSFGNIIGAQINFSFHHTSSPIRGVIPKKNKKSVKHPKKRRRGTPRVLMAKARSSRRPRACMHSDWSAEYTVMIGLPKAVLYYYWLLA